MTWVQFMDHAVKVGAAGAIVGVCLLAVGAAVVRVLRGSVDD